MVNRLPDYVNLLCTLLNYFSLLLTFIKVCQVSTILSLCHAERSEASLYRRARLFGRKNRSLRVTWLNVYLVNVNRILNFACPGLWTMFISNFHLSLVNTSLRFSTLAGDNSCAPSDEIIYWWVFDILLDYADLSDQVS